MDVAQAPAPTRSPAAPALTGSDLAALAARAEAVLRANWRGSHTVPSASLYPHQWSWDSAFTAIGLAPGAQRRAQVELATLFGAQWPDGRVPHIVFDPDTPADAYFPGPRFWATGTGLRRTSGIVQPPVHARAAWELYRIAPDREAAAGFLRRAYEPLCAWHSYLLTRRDLGAGGLAAIVHPWESGMDNSPAWDAALARVDAGACVDGGPAAGPRRDLRHVPATQRPGDVDYAAYVALASAYREGGYADGVPHAFAVEDPLFNGVLAWSEEALARIAAVVGADHAAHTARAHRLGGALVERLYDPDAGMFAARDLRTSALLAGWSSAGLAALVAPGLPPSVRTRVVAAATGGRFGRVPGSQWLLPSADRTATTYDPQRYWRGPAWANVTWVVRHGLLRSGRRAAAESLATGLLRTVARAGFREYFDADTGEGAGAADFSWTAAVVLDLVRERTRRS